MKAKEKNSIIMTIGGLWDIVDHIRVNEKENIIKEIDKLLKSNRKTMGFTFTKNDTPYSLVFKKFDIDESTLGLTVVFNNVKFGVLHFDVSTFDDDLTSEEGDSIVSYFSEEIVKKAFLSWYETHLTYPIADIDDFKHFDEKITQGLAMLGCGCRIQLTENTFTYTLFRDELDIITQLSLAHYYDNIFSIMMYVSMIESANFNTLSSLISQRIIGENIEVKIEEVNTP